MSAFIREADIYIGCHAAQCQDVLCLLSQGKLSTIKGGYPKTDSLDQDYPLTGDRQANLRLRGLNRGFRTV
jgi:hypothetical protein